MDPTILVGVGGRSIRRAEVDGTRTVQNFIQGQGATITLLVLEQPLPTTAVLVLLVESCINPAALAIVVVLELVPVAASRPSIFVFYLRWSSVLTTSLLGEPGASLRAKPGHHLHDIGHGPGLGATELYYEKFLVGVISARKNCIFIAAANDLVFLPREASLAATY